jgi:hypothetical protein
VPSVTRDLHRHPQGGALHDIAIRLRVYQHYAIASVREPVQSIDVPLHGGEPHSREANAPTRVANSFILSLHARNRSVTRPNGCRRSE